MRIHVRPGSGLVLAALVSTACAVGCDSTTEPSSRWSELKGTWDFSFVAVDSTPCDPPVPQGCSGGGTIRLEGSFFAKRGTWTGGGGCQDCGGAADFAGGELVDLRASSTTIAFRSGEFRFAAPLSPGEIEAIAGTMVFEPAFGDTVHGTWSMTRTP
jgi:hypothetical protein